MAASLIALNVAFVLAPSAGPAVMPARSSSVSMQFGGFKLPKMPKIDMGGIQFEEGMETTTMLKAAPGDVQFSDADGDVITLRKSTFPGADGKVDYFNGEVMKIQAATMAKEGEGLLLSGVDRTTRKFKASSGSFKEVIDELAVPTDPADVTRALALLE